MLINRKAAAAHAASQKYLAAPDSDHSTSKYSEFFNSALLSFRK
jgi:hypothetical protein